MSEQKPTMNVIFEAVYDTDPHTDNIEHVLYCTKCLREFEDGAGGPDAAPKDYARTQFGIRKDGSMQIWCNRHNQNVAVITMVGRVDGQPRQLVDLKSNLTVVEGRRLGSGS